MSVPQSSRYADDVVDNNSDGRQWIDLLRAVSRDGQDPATREFVVGEFLRRTEKLNKAIASGLCRDYRADRNTWLDDFWQLVRIAAATLVEEVIDSPDRADEIRDYPALLKFRSRSAATRFVDSSAGFNATSGQAGLKRRRRELERTRAHLYSQGFDPTDEQIVEVTNERMLKARSDAARQGMICTVDDLRVSEVAENIEDHAHPVSADTVESESELHAVERERLIAACIEAATGESEQLGQIARLWFMPATDAEVDTYDGHPTAASIAVIVGIEASTARAKVARVRQIAQHVARERFGFRAGNAERPRPQSPGAPKVSPQRAPVEAPLA